MFYSRCSYKEYINFIQNEEVAPEHLSLDLENDEDINGDDVNDEDNVAQIYFDPYLIYIPEGFN